LSIGRLAKWPLIGV